MRRIFLLTLFAISSVTFAQVNTVYSRFGVGTVLYGTTARDLSFGELGTAIYDEDRINLLNPASYGSFILTRADFGQVLEATFVKDATRKSYYGGGYLPGFNVGFPISIDHGVGLVFGANKYSDVSYEGSRDATISTSGSLVPSTVKEEYSYDGGITKIFMGTSYRFPFGWNIGVTADFLLGHYEYESTAKFSSTSVVDGIYARQQNFKGFTATFGLLSNNLNEYLGIPGLEELRISAGYTLSSTLKGDYANFTVNNFGFHDTLSKGDLETVIPVRTFAGISLKVNPRTKIFADYLAQSWEDFSMTSSTPQTLANTFKLSAGIEYNPNLRSATYTPDLSYRLGVSYEKLPYLLSGESAYRITTGAGISIPLSPANYIDLGLQYSFNTSSYANVIKDNTLRFMVGISVGELWFLRNDY